MVEVEVPVAWGDMDAMGHVNNTVFLRWFETARIRLFEEIGLSARRVQRSTVGPILAHTRIDFRRPVTYPDTVTARIRVSKVGNTSITMGYQVTSRAAGGALVAEGETVIVVIDYATGEKVPVPADIRLRLEAHA